MVNPAGAIQRVAFFCLKRWIRLCHPAVTSITPEQLQRILAGEEQGDWLILDARSPAEFASSHLPGAARIEAGGGIAGLGSMAALARDRPIRTPADSPSSSMPSAASLNENFIWIAGMRDTQVPHMAPLTTNVRKIATAERMGVV